jgi:diguanylate cyclase (GGDEF)-like protein/PAS domain S-box-containing protein
VAAVGPQGTTAQASRGSSLGRFVRLLPALVTAGMAALTLAGVAATTLQARRDATARGARMSADIRAQTIDTVDATIKRTEDLAASVGASWPTRSAIFTAVARGLSQSPVINGVGLIERITAARRRDFERRHGTILTRTSEGTPQPAPPRSSYLVVGSSVQTTAGPSGVGLDVGAESSRRATLLAASAAGRPRATPPVRLMSSDMAGTVLYTPIYGPSGHTLQTPAERAHALLGFVSTGYRYDLLLRALQRTIPSGTVFSLSDSGTTLLAQGVPRRPIRTQIAVAGRTWTLAVQSPSPDLSLPITILLVGGLLTLLVGTLGVQAKRRERYAQELVARRLAEREVAERALAQAEERFRTAFAEAPIGMALTSLEGRFLQVNHALSEITGYDEQQLLALAFATELTHPDDRRADRRGAARMRNGETRIYDAENRYLHAAGHTVWVAIHTTLIRDEHDAPAYFLSQIEDISARRRSELRLRHMANHDSLTGLLNRRAYERRLEEHLSRGERYGHDGAVLVIDLDDFKEVNDTLGHRAGDDLIVRVAGALATRLRESDTLARLGGDEFAILTPTGGTAEAERLAESLLETVRLERAARGPGGRARPMTASIGIAPLASAVDLSAEEALINADLAMYDAKEAGRDRSETYGGPGRGQARIEARLEWVERIRAALDEDRLVLHAQPVVETATGHTTQHELLVRMVDVHGDLIQPGSFLPIAERFGLIREIDRWVVTRAIQMLAEHRAAGILPTVEINISGHSLGDPELAEYIGQELRTAAVDARQLIFEVTETTAVDNIAAARTFAEQLGELGCRFALDDFGAGFGSFYYLKHLPFDFIKIDGEFVRNCTTDPTDRLVIRAVVELARGMGKLTIAEFVGDESTLHTLRELGVDYAQGFHLGRPAPLESWLGRATSPAPVARAGGSYEERASRARHHSHQEIGPPGATGRSGRE